MIIHAITLVRNEADIWPHFLTHNARFFDRITIVDHQSTDGTLGYSEAAVASASPLLELLRYGHRGYFQSELSNALVRRAFNAGADWVFVIDADEFLDFEDRDAFEASLPPDTDVVALRWKNIIPTTFGSFDQFDIGQDLRWSGRLSRYGKIGLSARFAARFPRFHIHMGNHFVAVDGTRSAPAPAAEIGALLHLPIRSMDRLRYKVASGMDAYKARSRKQSKDGFHWRELHQKFQSGLVDKAMLRGLASQYGETSDLLRSIEEFPIAWPSVTLEQPIQTTRSAKPVSASLDETTRRDAALDWDHRDFPRGTAVGVHISETCVRLIPRASGHGLFDDLRAVATRAPGALRRYASLLFGLFAPLRPRR